ncbi:MULTISPECIES: hypothetical protein [Bacillus cereus group]|uniref:hypothetical protein n=1 Tax=Bacillus cereus group TaxID=86661 RepID=UPI000B41531C|nr:MULTISPECIES: hypothetical protein [Bacillus cereus group]ARX66057.1 hypothetical protein BVH75_08385 [Bacillus thuringiensis]MCJ0846326.1 hypothetical protein [Bacillus cereus]MEB9694784.1 hypothetical protein [Bacillus cereus]
MEDENRDVPTCSACNEPCMWTLKMPLTINYLDKTYIREVTTDNANICIECLEKEVQTIG